MGARGQHVCVHTARMLWTVLTERRVAATDVMNEYFDEIGGRPEPKAGQKRKGRASGVGVATESESGTPVASAKRTKQIKKEAIKKKPVWAPPPGSWEHEVEYIDTVEENIDAKTGLPMRFVYVLWNGGQKTQHPLKIINQKCPQKVRTGAARLRATHPGTSLTALDARVLREPPRLF
jgi:hypothetical protein